MALVLRPFQFETKNARTKLNIERSFSSQNFLSIVLVFISFHFFRLIKTEHLFCFHGIMKLVSRQLCSFFKVLYGSANGFHAVDLDSASVYDIYTPKHAQGIFLFKKIKKRNIKLKGVFSKPSGKWIVVPNFCFLNLAICLFFLFW